MSIRLLTFDLDHTLWDTHPVIERAEQAMYQWLVQRCPAVGNLYSIDSLRRYRIHIAQSYPELIWQVSRQRRHVLRLVLLQAGVAAAQLESWTEQAFQVFYQERSRLTLFPQGREVLEYLAQRYALVALTNGNADLDLIGIGHLFQAYYNAESVGAPKPDPCMFVTAMQEQGVGAAASIHIGDSPEMDIAPAQALGMKTIWANFYGLEWPESCAIKPDAIITQLRDLPAAIAAVSA